MTSGLENRYSIQLSYGDNEGLMTAKLEPLTVLALYAVNSRPTRYHRKPMGSIGEFYLRPEATQYLTIYGQLIVN